jgi:hypothetical protein
MPGLESVNHRLAIMISPMGMIAYQPNTGSRLTLSRNDNVLALGMPRNCDRDR